jgi:plasmid stabilization system protein ParE
MDYQVGLTDEALADLRGIAEFIARQSPRMAERVGGELLDVAESLAEFPNRGVPVKGRSEMRKVFRWSYAIYYRVKAHERRVEVLRIWDARQAPWKLKLP